MTKNGGFGGFYVVISIHTALAGCDKGYGIFTRPSNISIHTALAGCDYILPDGRVWFVISIHTALAGCDIRQKYFLRLVLNFNPHSPRRL